MNILFLLPTYPGVGGIEKVTNYLANYFCRCHRIVVASQNRLPNPEMLKQLDKRVKYIELPNIENRISYENVLLVNRIIRDYEINTVIYQDSYDKFNKIVGKINPELRKLINLIVVEHNAPCCFIKQMKYYLSSLRCNSVKNMVKKILSPLLILKIFIVVAKSRIYMYNKADHYVLLSEKFMREFWWINLFRTKKVTAIGNPLTIELQPIIKKEKKQLLFVGSLNKRKGVDMLMEIWKRIEQRTKEWNLLLLGDGEERLYIESYINKHNLTRITVLGFQTDTIRYLQESKILLMTSRYEGFPLVLGEAMAYGCVPVAFNSFASISDIVTEETGVLVKPFDIDDYAENIIRLIDNEEELKRKSEACVLRGRRDFSIEAIAAKWNEII